MGKHILVTSISSWNQKTGSDTFSSLFKTFDPRDLANIYISGDIPDSQVCSRYFHIDEMSVVKSVFNRRQKTGVEVAPISTSESTNRAINSTKRQLKRRRIYLWMREIAWKFGCWKSKDLKEFLKDFRPEVLVFSIEAYPYFNRLNNYIIKECKPKKVIGYLWDDNFTYKQQPNSPIFKIERFFLRKHVRWLVNNCTDVLAISPKMKEECDAEFGINSIVLTKPIFNQQPFQNYDVSIPNHILYTGKLIIGRENTIATIAQTIKKLNSDGQKVILDVYTNTILSEELKSKIDIPECCVLHAPVPQSEVAGLQSKADVLLFAESLSDDNLTARLSFSTKLTDYFAAGKCIWAVGNMDLGPISYIKNENAGFVSSNKDEIDSVLESFISDATCISNMAKSGYECGIRNHNGNQIITTLKNVIYGE